VTQEEALANADSATNLLWLINNTEAGSSLAPGASGSNEGKPRPESTPQDTGSFSEFKLDTSEA